MATTKVPTTVDVPVGGEGVDKVSKRKIYQRNYQKKYRQLKKRESTGEIVSKKGSSVEKKVVKKRGKRDAGLCEILLKMTEGGRKNGGRHKWECFLSGDLSALQKLGGTKKGAKRRCSVRFEFPEMGMHFPILSV